MFLGDEDNDDTECFREYGNVILSEDHCAISEVEVRRTSVQVVEEWDESPGLPGVTVKEIPDRKSGDYSLRLCDDEYCSILLYRDDQSENDADSENGGQDDIGE